MSPDPPLPGGPDSCGVVLGIDIGGSGSRLILQGPGVPGLPVLTGPRVEIRAAGSSVGEVLGGLLQTARRQWPDHLSRVVAVGVGATGLASLVARPEELREEVVWASGLPAAVAIDAVTAHLGALDGGGGAVIALGTGAIAVGHPGAADDGSLAPEWRRVDGWGHLLGDRGGGAWIGRTGLERALETHDGLGSHGAALLAAAHEQLGAAQTWPAQLYGRDDRAGVLAEFAAQVIRLGDSGDPESSRILASAGREAARSALTALPRGTNRVALSGGIAASHQVLESFRAEIGRVRPDIVITRAPGGPLEGAVVLGQLAATGRVCAQPGFIWV